MLDRMRDRIHHGFYFGAMRPGDRLPSIRDIAAAEAVNRKTVASAYLRLQRDGLVEIRPRSGIYLRGPAEETAAAARPLQRLQRKWLEQAYAGARAVGLGTADILQIVNAVAAVERSRIPVVTSSVAEASAIGAELHARLSIQTIPVSIAELDAAPALLADATIALCTPWHAPAVASARAAATIVPIAVSEELVDVLRGAASLLLVVTPDEAVAERIRSGLTVSGWESRSRVVVMTAADARPDAVARFPFERVLVWPGCDPAEVKGITTRLAAVRGLPLLSRATVERVQRAILEEALRRVTGARDVAQ